ncbi:MAG: ferrochelatase [Acidobacteriota bacterium]
MASASPRIGILLLQLGTPDAPTPGALRRYLRQFLLDRRVIELPRAVWWPILNLFVLPRRPAKSAKLYQKVWSPGGSPLLVTTCAQAAALAERLDRTNPGRVLVTTGMRYGHPSIAFAADELIAAGCDRILAFPMYPQYASATTGSSIEELFDHLGTLRVVPSVRVVPPYFDDPAYIAALAQVARLSLGDFDPEQFVISFHGLPKRYATMGDPYPEQCIATARALIVEMGWPAERVTTSFQSRFGREEWLTPYTDESLVALAGRGVSTVAALCPGFTADCLETIEEMGITNRKMYQKAGGTEYRLLPCLNVAPVWSDAMATIARRELSGWI